METILLGIVLVAVCIAALNFRRLFKSKEGTVTTEAEVISRRGEMPDGSYSNFRGSKMKFLVTFRVNGEPLELLTDSIQYTRLMEGAHGQLTYQGNNLISFLPASDER